ISVDVCEKAMVDWSTWDRVVDDILQMVERIGWLGVPTLMLDSSDGLVVFGPVISEPPDDEEAVDLWRHTTWLMRNENFAEFKRKRVALPDLAMIQWRREQQAAAARTGS